MARYCFHIPQILALLACLIGLPMGAQEADDDMRFARPGYLNFPMSTQLQANDDVDWYRLEVFRPGNLTIRYDVGPTAGAFPIVTGRRDDVDFIFSPPVTSEDGTVSQSVQIEPGELFLAFTGEASETDYLFEISLESLSDADLVWRGIDGVPDAAGSFPVDLDINTAPRIFNLSLSEPAVLVIRSRDEVSGAVRFAGQVVNSSTGATVRQDPYYEPGEDAYVMRNRLGAGEYEVQIHSYNNVVTPTRLIFMTSDFGDAFEPNDTPEMARPIPLNTRVSGVQTYRGDVDWLEVDLPDEGDLVFTFAAIEPETGGHPVAYLFDPDNTNSRLYETNWNSASGTLRFNNLSAGRYLLRVTGPDQELVTEVTALFSPNRNPEDSDPNTRFFLVGLAPEGNESLETAVEVIASAGGGETIAMTSNDMELGLTLAEIVSDTEGRGMNLLDVLRASSQVMSQRHFTRPENTLGDWVEGATVRFAATGLFEPVSATEGDLAAREAGNFRARMQRYFAPSEKN